MQKFVKEKKPRENGRSFENRCADRIGSVFVAKKNLYVDVNCIKRKFYAALNGISYRGAAAHKPVKLYLVKSYCVSLLTYCTGALDLNMVELAQLKTCWNDAFRKRFGYRKHDSVKQLQYFCNELPFDYIYDLALWHFRDTVKDKLAFLREFCDSIECERSTCVKFYELYKPVTRSYNCKRQAMYSHFVSLQYR